MSRPDPLESLAALVAEDDQRPVPAGTDAVVAAVRQRFGASVAAVLFYGSCLRRGTFEGVVDVYVLVDDYRTVYGASWLGLANRALPPNVFHVTAPTAPAPTPVKAAVMSLDQFERAMAPEAWSPSVWARFAQPAVLAHARDERTGWRVSRARARAVATALWHGARLAPAGAAPLDLWRAVFRATYATELRAETVARADLVVEADAPRYAALTGPGLAAAGDPAIGAGGWRARTGWRLRRAVGKALSVVRLAKAAFTFEGGADYLAWKIERHTGVAVTPTPWQRRHPILALPWLVWRLKRRGVIR
jgi:hypothetical protein